MTRHIRRLMLAIIGGSVALNAAANPPAGEGRFTQPFGVAELFFELNATDGDLGLHGVIDGGPWTTLEITAPGDRPLLEIAAEGRLARQGLTQLAFESAEPPFDELAPDVFFRRFPEGQYEIEATAQDGGRFRSTVRLSHVLAAPVEPTVSGLRAAENCDAPALPEVDAPVLIDWRPVTESHPTLGKPGHVNVSRYQLFVEQGDIKLSIDLPPTITEFEIPPSITASRGVFKFEIITRTSTGNNTAVESCFKIR